MCSSAAWSASQTPERTAGSCSSRACRRWARLAAGVLLATSTLSISLSALRRQVARKVAECYSGSRQADDPAAARVVGLRFLAPVVFIPFVEVTLTAAQMEGPEQAHRQDLFGVLSAWGKSAFFCTVSGAADEDETANMLPASVAARLISESRVRLDSDTISTRQSGEARLRHARLIGPERVAEITALQLYNFAEPTCCVCLTAPATVSSLLCGHRVLCAGCAEMLIDANPEPTCPLCRKRFVSAA